MRHIFGPLAPFARPGQVVGLLGGSFDPPHQGHVHISREAIKRFGLDQVWWLVSPGNPLKSHGPAELDQRLDACRMLAQDPRILATGIEAVLGTHYTAETLEALVPAYRGTRFVWLMGEDNLQSFHRWERWPGIMAQVPVGVLARPGQSLSARTARAARKFRWARMPSSQSQLLGHAAPPAWCHVMIPMRAISSTALRAQGVWTQGG